MNNNEIKQIKKDIKFIQEDNKGKDLNKIYYGGITAKEYLKALNKKIKLLKNINKQKSVSSVRPCNKKHLILK